MVMEVEPVYKTCVLKEKKRWEVSVGYLMLRFSCLRY